MATFPISIDSAGGEYMESVLVVGWAKQPGDRIKAGDLLVTVETAKAATEIEAEHDGFLATIQYSEGQEAPVGAVLGTLSDTDVILDSKLVRHEADPASVDLPNAAGQEPSPADTAPGKVSSGRIIASPLARRLAQAARLDLATISGSGPKGRIKQRDIAAALTVDKIAATVPADGRTEAEIAPPGPIPSARPQRSPDPIVLLHGFAADRSLWRQVIPLLSTAHEVIALDLPGHGSEAATSVAGIEAIALDLSDRLEAMSVSRAHLVGHSLGGAAALSLSALGRLAVRSVTLFAPGGLGPEINGGFISGLSSATSAEALDQWLGVMVAERSSLPAGYAAAAFRQFQRTGNAATLAMMASVLFPGGTQAFNLKSALSALTVPTRLVWGKADRVVPAAHAIAAPGFAALHLLDGVGHVPPIEAPALAARLIAETVLSAG